MPQAHPFHLILQNMHMQKVEQVHMQQEHSSLNHTPYLILQPCILLLNHLVHLLNHHHHNYVCQKSLIVHYMHFSIHVILTYHPLGPPDNQHPLVYSLTSLRDFQLSCLKIHQHQQLTIEQILVVIDRLILILRLFIKQFFVSKVLLNRRAGKGNTL